MTVTGGASPGLYERSSDTLEDRNVYTQTEDGEVVAHFRFLEGSIRRRLEENFEGLDDAMVAGRTLRGVGEAALAAEAAAGRSLTACATGFWANLQGVVPAASTSATADILYPFYVTADCADDPSGVTTEWLSIACESCEQVADDTLVIECTASIDSSVTAPPSPSASSSRETSAPSGTPAPTLAPTDGSGEMGTSSPGETPAQSTTPAPTGGSRGIAGPTERPTDAPTDGGAPDATDSIGWRSAPD
eukprot:jgi/Undpi1/12655/HiC_scaffold_6.g02323.m1